MEWRFRKFYQTKENWNVYGAAWNWDDFRGLHIFVGKNIFSAGWVQD